MRIVRQVLVSSGSGGRLIDEIQVGDRVVVINAFGLRIDCVVEAITEEHGTKLYHVASENFALTVSEKQIAEVHKH